MFFETKCLSWNFCIELWKFLNKKIVSKKLAELCILFLDQHDAQSLKTISSHEETTKIHRLSQKFPLRDSLPFSKRCMFCEPFSHMPFSRYLFQFFFLANCSPFLLFCPFPKSGLRFVFCPNIFCQKCVAKNIPPPPQQDAHPSSSAETDLHLPLSTLSALSHMPKNL